MSPKQFKIALVGDAGVGKTSFTHRMLEGEFMKKHIPSDIIITLHTYYTSSGTIQLELHDIPSHLFNDQSFEHFDAIMMMCDVSNKVTYDNLLSYYAHITKTLIDVPTVICGNKFDLNREVLSKDIDIHRVLCCNYYDISVKSCYNYQKPFRYLMAQLVDDQDLHLVEQLI